MSRNSRFLSIAVVSAWLLASAAGCQAEANLKTIRLPEGFRIEIYAGDVPNARSMALGAKGTLFVGTRKDTVYAIPREPGPDGKRRATVIASGLESPNGVAFRDGSLYVAEISRVLRFDDIESRLHDPGKPAVVSKSFPSDKHHGWKFIAFGPDGMLYVPVGAPCNVCENDDPVYAAIHRMKPDGTGLELFASGVRNTVGFDWHPETKELWFTDNGRDWMGDDLPPDELNRAPRKGLHFGFPYRHGKGISDPDFGSREGARRFTPPEMELGAHVASLGMRFYTGTMFPEKYRNQVFIAEHGSWNRSIPNGYRITMVTLEGGRAAGYGVFAEGWLRGGSAWGRPVDLLVMPDGGLLVSDDKAGAIYRIVYEKSR